MTEPGTTSIKSQSVLGAESPKLNLTEMRGDPTAVEKKMATSAEKTSLFIKDNGLENGSFTTATTYPDFVEQEECLPRPQD